MPLRKCYYGILFVGKRKFYEYLYFNGQRDKIQVFGNFIFILNDNLFVILRQLISL